MGKFIKEIICLAIMLIVITGCGNKIDYSCKYDIYVNGININSDVIILNGGTKNYLKYVNHSTYTTDINLTFAIYENPVTENNIDVENY